MKEYNGIPLIESDIIVLRALEKKLKIGIPS